MTDIILCAFNCGGSFNCSEEAEKFSQPPKLVYIPGNGSNAFKQYAINNHKNDSVLDNILKDVGRVALITFSAGWGFTTEVLKSKKDRERIDTIILLDGLHQTTLDDWKAFVLLAGRGGKNAPKLWMLIHRLFHHLLVLKLQIKN
ncbi:MAG: hypothetical protein HC877_23305 [Thioploca sp.]|nr:hypothetical protein [Thioploca sp.]